MVTLEVSHLVESTKYDKFLEIFTRLWEIFPVPRLKSEIIWSQIVWDLRCYTYLISQLCIESGIVYLVQAIYFLR